MKQLDPVARAWWPALLVCTSLASASGCVGGAPEQDTGSASFLQGAAVAPTDYAPSASGSGVGPDTGATAGAAAPPVSSGPVPTQPVSPSGTAGSAPPSAAGTGGASAGPGPGGASGTSAGVAGMDIGTAGTGITGAGGSDATPPPVSSGPGTLTVEITSAAIGGRYAPRNIGAIWIETASGDFVKTIERWAAIRGGDLRTWNQRSGGWGFSFFGVSSAPDAMDAVTGATLTSHRAHTPTWAMKDVMGAVVPDGSYKVVLEVADGTAGTAEVMFQKGPMPQTVTAPAGGRGYSAFTVTYTP